MVKNDRARADHQRRSARLVRDGNGTCQHVDTVLQCAEGAEQGVELAQHPPQQKIEPQRQPQRHRHIAGRQDAILP